ncbi:MAG: hypothetical protein Q9204_003365 [Flavoplaca sp. TL-2023a]
MKHDKTLQTKTTTKSTRSNSLLGETGRPLGYEISRFIESTERKQLATNISHYIDFAHEHLHMQQINFPSPQPVPSQPKPSTNIDWKMIVKSVAEEEEQLESVGGAAAILKMQYNHVRDLVKGYAKRKPKRGTRQTDQLIKDGDFAALAKNLSQTMFQLGWFYRNAVTEAYVRVILKRLHDHSSRIRSWRVGWGIQLCIIGRDTVSVSNPGYKIPERVKPIRRVSGLGMKGLSE